MRRWPTKANPTQPKERLEYRQHLSVSHLIKAAHTVLNGLE
jgi:hypothetical protein